MTIDHLKIKKIIIVDKQPSPFRHGFWDIDLKFVFEYRLTFREADGCVIACIRANNIFNMKLSLFGSVGNDLVIGTDLLRSFNDSATFDAEPFIWVEAKAVVVKRLQCGRKKIPPFHILIKIYGFTRSKKDTDIFTIPFHMTNKGFH